MSRERRYGFSLIDNVSRFTYRQSSDQRSPLSLTSMPPVRISFLQRLEKERPHRIGRRAEAPGLLSPDNEGGGADDVTFLRRRWSLEVD
jgi:hypothetical protein